VAIAAKMSAVARAFAIENWDSVAVSMAMLVSLVALLLFRADYGSIFLNSP